MVYTIMVPAGEPIRRRSHTGSDQDSSGDVSRLHLHRRQSRAVRFPGQLLRSGASLYCVLLNSSPCDGEERRAKYQPRPHARRCRHLVRHALSQPLESQLGGDDQAADPGTIPVLRLGARIDQSSSAAGPSVGPIYRSSRSPPRLASHTSVSLSRPPQPDLAPQPAQEVAPTSLRALASLPADFAATKRRSLLGVFCAGRPSLPFTALSENAIF